MDSDAAVGEQLTEAKNGRDVVAQIGILVESKDQQSGSMMVLGGLGAVLLLTPKVGMGRGHDASVEVASGPEALGGGLMILVFHNGGALYAGGRAEVRAEIWLQKGSSATPRVSAIDHDQDALAELGLCRFGTAPIT